jgi:hypothetical protein
VRVGGRHLGCRERIEGKRNLVSVVYTVYVCLEG